MARIFVVGSGVIGTATGSSFARMGHGHQVTFIDVLPSRVEALRAEGFDAQLGIDLVAEEASFLFLTLPTPQISAPAPTPPGQAPERRYDLTMFTAGVCDVAYALRDAGDVHTVVVRSTVPPGTTSGLVQPLIEEISGKNEGTGFSLAVNPEFLRAACATEDFRHPWMSVIGARSKRTGERLAQLLQPFGGTMRIFDQPKIAETIKVVHNAFNATKISFFNEMWGLCSALGIDGTDVSSTVALSAEGSWNPSYGIKGGMPYGGDCLPKDTNGLLGFARDIGVEMPLLEATIAVNENLAARLAATQVTEDPSALTQAINLADSRPVLGQTTTLANRLRGIGPRYAQQHDGSISS